MKAGQAGREVETVSTLPPSEKGPPGPPYTEWRRLGLAPEPGLYIQRDDQLFIRTRSSLAVHVNVAVRLQLPEDGRVVPQLFDVVTVADRSEQLSIFGLAEGFALGVVAFSLDAALDEGAVYIEVGLIRGGAGLLARVQVFFAGYLGQGDALTWPHVTQEPAHVPPGRVRVIVGTNPAAGAESIETVPTGAHWLLYSWRIQLVTAVAVANRRLHLVLDDGGSILLDSACADTQAASLTRNYNAGLWGYAPIGVPPELYISAPNLIHLEGGFRIRTITENLQAADDYGAPVFQVVEMLT